MSKIPPGIWVQFADMEEYRQRENELFAAIADSDGKDNVVVFLKSTKKFKALPQNQQVSADEQLKQRLSSIFGKENVKIVTKPIENS